MTEASFSGRNLSRFVESTSMELGADQYDVMLGLSKLPPEWVDPKLFLKMDASESAKVYASLQAAMRTYFGRGARGVLLRVGQSLWSRLLDDSGLRGRTQAAVIRRLPLNGRCKQTLELLARLLGAPGDITVHTLDLDLLLADHASPTTLGSRTDSPICFVTQGLIRESLHWATGQNYDVEETSCKSCGEDACEFKIITSK